MNIKKTGHTTYKSYYDQTWVTVSLWGHFYSWSNKSIGEARTCSKIDRCIISSLWLTHYSNAIVEYMNLGISDHSPLVLQCVAAGQSKGRPFRFFNYMAEHECFLPILENSWGQYSGENMMQSIWRRLKEIKQHLKVIHKDTLLI